MGVNKKQWEKKGGKKSGGKLKKSLKKKCAKFKKNHTFFFFEVFRENVLKTLLRGRETTRKKYRIVFEKFLKYMIFFDFRCPSIHHHPPSTTTTIRQNKLALAMDPGGLENSGYIWKEYHISRKIEQISRKSRQNLNSLFYFLFHFFIFYLFFFFSFLFFFLLSFFSFYAFSKAAVHRLHIGKDNHISRKIEQISNSFERSRTLTIELFSYDIMLGRFQ